MLEINVTEEREIDFSMELGGISPNQLVGHLNILIDGIEYGIPVSFSESGMLVSIPPLKSFVKRDLREGELFKVRLDVFGDSHYLNPWNDEFKVKNPITMEAKIKEPDEGREDSKISLTLTEKKETIKEDLIIEPEKKQSRFKNPADFKKNVSKVDVLNWLTKRGTADKEIQELIYEQAVAQAESSQPYKVLLELTKVIKKR